MNRSTNIPHPIPYQGSKRKLAERILQLLPNRTTILVEPFAGSAAISLAAISQKRVDSVVINDLNAPLMELWREIVEHPLRLANAYEKLWRKQGENIDSRRIFYNAVRSRFNETHAASDFLFLLLRCVKASVRYNADGEFNQGPDNRRRGTAPSQVRTEVMRTSALLRGRITIHNQDYREILKSLPPDCAVYFDPPYQGVGGRDSRYLAQTSVEEFAHQLSLLNIRRVPYIVSYDGRAGEKSYGKPLPEELNLRRLEIAAGRSSQHTLIGKSVHTFESLYLSVDIIERLQAEKNSLPDSWLSQSQQLPLLTEPVSTPASALAL